jgi:4-hydroxybenzoate polyprenyltransferase
MPQPASFASPLFWRSFWITMRPYLAFVSGVAGLVGMAFAPSPRAWRVAVAFVPLFLAYGLGQALTDCFQLDTDARSSPYRPLVRGVISRGQVLPTALAGLAGSAAIVGALNPLALVPSLAAVAGLLAYTPLKRRWWGGPPCNSAVVAMVPVAGFLAVAGMGARVPEAVRAAAVASVLAVFLAYADFVVTGYLKDVSADRATGYRTVAVAHGWRAAAACGALNGTAAALACAWALWAMRGGTAAWVALGAGAALSARAHAIAFRVADERLAHPAIAGVLRAFILYAAALVLAARPAWLPFLVVLYLAFELELRRRPERTQI